MTEKNKERVQFDFSIEALQRLDEIKKRTGASTRAETVRNALKLYEWLASEFEPDDVIKVLKVLGEREETVAIVKFQLLLR